MKSILSRTGRCVGGEVATRIELIQKWTGYEISVKTGNHTFLKKIMDLKLKDCDLNQAKEKFYEIYALFCQLWEINENANDE